MAPKKSAPLKEVVPPKVALQKPSRTKTRAELLRLWEKLDPSSRGFLTVPDVLKHTKLLEAECPEFILQFEQLAKDGRVSRGDFFELLSGKRPSGGGSKAGSKEPSKSNVDLSELRNMFDDIAGPSGEIRVADLVKHRARIKEVFPLLLEKFHEIDLDKTSTVTWAELEVFAGGTVQWLEYQLDRIVGLELLKQQIRQFHQSVVLDRKRREAGHDVKTGGKYHMIFQGNPGTGKTSLARIVAQLLHRIGIVQTDRLVEVQRDKLVAEYVGQTGPKTQKVIQEAKQGVLFIDEAYRLSQEGGKSDFGREAIEQLMAAMNDPPGIAPVMIFAGYADDMENFMQANSGLYRRIAYTFDFSDYSSLELAQILDAVARGAGFQLSTSLTSEKYRRLAELIEKNTLSEAREMMNGGICERMFDLAKQSLDNRDFNKTSDSAPGLVLLEGDLLDACKKIPPPPARDKPDGSDQILLRRAEARMHQAEAEIKRLQEELSLAHVQRRPSSSPEEVRKLLAEEDYSIRACCRYSCACMRAFLGCGKKRSRVNPLEDGVAGTFDEDSSSP